VRFALGAAFLRAARFTFLRSILSSIFFVFANEKPLLLNLFNVFRVCGGCESYVNRDFSSGETSRRPREAAANRHFAHFRLNSNVRIRV
jgi:hypothetical protein